MDRPSRKRFSHGGGPSRPGTRTSQPHSSPGGHVDRARWVGQMGRDDWTGWRDRGGEVGGLRVEGVCHQDMSDFVENVQVSVYRGPLFLKVLQAKRGIVFSFLGYVLYTLSDAKHHFQVFVSFWEHCCNCKCASEA